MEATNHEYHVSFEVAKLLKEAGFDWEVQSYYSKLSRKQGRLLWLTCGCRYKENININQNRYSAPTLEVAQRWLREVKQCYVHVYPMFSFEGTLEYYFVEVIYPRSRNIKPNEFDTYEEALEAGIKTALEIILEKGEPDYGKIWKSRI